MTEDEAYAHYKRLHLPAIEILYGTLHKQSVNGKLQEKNVGRYRALLRLFREGEEKIMDDIAAQD